MTGHGSIRKLKACAPLSALEKVLDVDRMPQIAGQKNVTISIHAHR